jgi:NAD(P)-dependent dehydrogenase (short-subunit alcohol dehydrogenase family)
MRLDGKVAVITGGTSGMGRKMVERFVQEGAKVFFTGRRAALGAEVARLTGAIYVKADATVEADAVRTIATAAKANGRVDVLVNNANVPTGGGRMEDTPLAAFDLAMGYVRGAFAHIKYAVPLMRSQRQGSIVNIGSMAGQRGGLSTTTYSVAKAAVIHLSRCAAMELGEDNVRVNSISPGAIVTGIFGKAFGLDPDSADASKEKLLIPFVKAQPTPRAGLPEDIANAALYLASDESSFVNGTDLLVDGGFICGQRFSQAAGTFQALRSALV